MKKAKRNLRINVPTVRLNLYAFLFALTALSMLGVFSVLLLTGRLPAGSGDPEKFLSREFEYHHGNISEQFGEITVQLVSLSQAVSGSIEYYLAEKQINVAQIRQHPEILEELIGNELGRLQYALEKTDTSGVFLILDATVNPALDNAANSRAGMYIRKSEPHVSGAATAVYNYFRGFSRIAYQNNLNIMVKWDMEFDVENRDFYHIPMQYGMNSELPLSKLYYWNMESIINDPDEVMLSCSIPLTDSGGNVFGVCGFVISQWKFESKHIPDTADYRDTVNIFGALNNNGLDTGNIFHAGQQSIINMIRENTILPLPPGSDLKQLMTDNGDSFYVAYDEVKLYPNDSLFSDEIYTAALILSKKETDERLNREIIQLVVVCIALLATGLTGAFIFGKRYLLSPIESALIAIRAGKLEDVKTNIIEVDRLIEQVKTQRSDEKPFPDDFFADFLLSVKTLTPAEKRIFTYYINRSDDKEIMAGLFITKDALHKHNLRIFEKLNVSSKEVLVTYIELIKMSGQADKIM